MRDYKCKCSHLKSEHSKNIFTSRDCSKCPCNSYLRFNRPDKIDKGYTIFVSIAFITIICGIFSFYYNIQGGFNDKLVVAVCWLFTLLMLVIDFWLFNEILYYFKMKKRKIW